MLKTPDTQTVYPNITSSIRFRGEFVEHYQHERNHQGLGDQLVAPVATQTSRDDRIVSRQRLGGLSTYYYRPVASLRQTRHSALISGGSPFGNPAYVVGPIRCQVWAFSNLDVLIKA